MGNESLIRDSRMSQMERVVHLRIRPGSDLLAGIREGIRLHGITSGVFISGLGALERAVFRNLREFPEHYPVTPKDRLYYVVEKPLELLSVSGWIAGLPGGEPEVHAHISASYVDGDKVATAGGHLTDGVVASIKVVVAIGVLAPGSFKTSFDDETQSLDIDLS